MALVLRFSMSCSPAYQWAAVWEETGGNLRQTAGTLGVCRCSTESCQWLPALSRIRLTCIALTLCIMMHADGSGWNINHSAHSHELRSLLTEALKEWRAGFLGRRYLKISCFFVACQDCAFVTIHDLESESNWLHPTGSWMGICIGVTGRGIKVKTIQRNSAQPQMVSI